MDPSLHLVIHTTGACNFRCQYCALDFQKKAMSKEVQDSIINFVRRNISKYNRVIISWFGGEPLLEMGVIEHISKEVMEICRKARKPYIGAITSNGYLLTPENIETLIRCRVMYYTITIDGLKETHDRQRFLANGKPTFDTIIGNLRYIRNRVTSPLLRVVVRTNMTREIVNRLSDYYQFYDSEFGTDSRFSLFVRPVGDWGGDRVKKMNESLLEMDEMTDLLLRLSHLKGTIKFENNFGDLEIGGVTCPATNRNKYTIGTEGQITKCDDSDFKYTIGHLRPDGTADIDRYQETLWVVGHRNRTKCDDCDFGGSCMMNSCPKESLLEKYPACGYSQYVNPMLILAAASMRIEKI